MLKQDMQDLYDLVLLQCTCRGYSPVVKNYTYNDTSFKLEDAEAITKNLILCGKNPIKATKNGTATKAITDNWIALMSQLYNELR